ncbi:MAG TPA: hypothetical protein VMV10_05630 [Pirellulales bacterium]|nr:hypothetical protein [Pirellulales bacterium]
MTSSSHSPGDHSPDHAQPRGKPPKSAGAIRDKLDSLHENRGEAPAAGPQAAGMQADDQLVIASFYSREVARGYLERLAAAGVLSAKLRPGFRQDQVLVDCSDRQRAAELLAVHLAGTPDRMSARYRRSIDFLLLGAVLGATLGSIGIASETMSGRTLVSPRGLLTALGFMLYGGVIGLFLGNIDDKSRGAGRFQFSLRDIFLATTLLALLFLSQRVLLIVWR